MSVVCLAVFSVHIVRPHAQTNYIVTPTQQSLLKCLLVLHRLVRLLTREVGVDAWRWVRVRVVLGEDAGAIVNREDENRLDAEEGQRTRHGAVFGGV
jgi:hypothetical protein